MSILPYSIMRRQVSRIFGAKFIQRTLASQPEKILPTKDQVFTGNETVPERWEWVERVLPNPLVPNPPTHASYPTPSGWIPPQASQSGPYAVRRTRNHMFPVYVEVPTGEKGLRQYTKIKHVEGDIWAFEADLRRYLEEKTAKRIYIQVKEYSMTAIVDGIYHQEVSDFLIQKGF